MRKFVIVATLSFFLVSCERNYIKNLQIEGISLGDSALDFFDENQIKDNEWDYYKNKYYTPVQLERMPFFKTYDAVDFSYKTGDGNYKIHDLTGRGMPQKVVVINYIYLFLPSFHYFP